MIDFAARFNSLLDETGARVPDVAAALDISQQSVRAWRTGARTPKPPTVAMVAAHFGVSPEWLAGGDVPRQASRPAPERHTVEARIISHGVDSMPPDQRQRAVRMFQLIFEQYADQFKEGSDES